VDTGTLSSWTLTFNGYYTLTANTAIPDNNAAGITSTINVPAIGTIVSLRVRVDITHTFQGDLEVALIGPDNTTVLLHNRTGASADNIQTVYADLTVPAQALAAFTGKAINGAWKLRVRDLAALDTGTLNFWEIDFRADSSPCPCTASQRCCGGSCVSLTYNCGACNDSCLNHYCYIPGTGCIQKTTCSSGSCTTVAANCSGDYPNGLCPGHP